MIEAMRSIFVAQAIVLLEDLDFGMEIKELPVGQTLWIASYSQLGFDTGKKKWRTGTAGAMILPAPMRL